MHGCLYARLPAYMHACIHAITASLLMWAACIYACILAYMYACLHTCTPACMYERLPAYMHACIHCIKASLLYMNCLHICMPACLPAYMHGCLHIYRSPCIYDIHGIEAGLLLWTACIYAYLPAWIMMNYTWSMLRQCWSVRNMFICLYVYKCIHI